MSAEDRRQAFRFFCDHAGYSTPPGRAVCALELARAETLLRAAEAEGVAAVEWEYEDSWTWGDLGDAWTEEEMRTKFDSNEWTGPFWCALKVGEPPACDCGSGDDADVHVTGCPILGETLTNPRTVASLGGIVLGPRGTGDPYARVVAAELAAEAAEDLRQAVGDARDAREAVTA